MLKSSNLDIYSTKFSNILISSSSKKIILQTSRPLNLRSSQFHTLSSAASRQKNTPTGTTFSSVAFGQKQNHRSRKPCPNRFKACGLKGERKTCPSAALIQKQACRRKNIFPMRGKIGPSGINDEAPKGRGKGGPVLLFEAKNRPTGRGIHHILIYFPLHIF